jgi:hypothetical protein
MTQFGEKTDRIIIEDIKDIRDSAKEIITLCNTCLKIMRQIHVEENEWSEVTTRIRKCYEHMEYVMEEKRGRF